MLNDDVEKYKREGRQQAFAEVLAWARTAKELFGKNASPVTRETVVQLLGGLEGFARDEATEQAARESCWQRRFTCTLLAGPAT